MLFVLIEGLNKETKNANVESYSNQLCPSLVILRFDFNLTRVGVEGNMDAFATSPGQSCLNPPFLHQRHRGCVDAQCRRWTLIPTKKLHSLPEVDF